MSSQMEAIEQRYTEWAQAHSVKQSHGSRCLRRLAGKQCQMKSINWLCICESSYQDFGFDHTRLWIKDGKPICLTTEPYQLNDEHKKQLESYCEQNRFILKIHPRSLWSPGNTIMVEIWKQAKTPL